MLLAFFAKYFTNPTAQEKVIKHGEALNKLIEYRLEVLENERQKLKDREQQIEAERKEFLRSLQIFHRRFDKLRNHFY